MTIRGIDVSAVQGHVDWDAVARSGVRFAFLKCATGNEGGLDPRYRENVQNARSAGITIGPYNFAYPLPLNAGHPGRGPREQAENHFGKAGGLGNAQGDLPPVLDLEWPAPENWPHWFTSAALIRDWGLGYLARYEELSGRVPMVYTYPWFWGKVAASGEVGDYARYPLWLASYTHPPLASLLPWGAPTFVQTSGGGGKLPSGAPVDENVFMGSEDDFAVFVGADPKQKTNPCGGA